MKKTCILNVRMRMRGFELFYGICFMEYFFKIIFDPFNDQ